MNVCTNPTSIYILFQDAYNVHDDLFHASAQSLSLPSSFFQSSLYPSHYGYFLLALLGASLVRGFPAGSHGGCCWICKPSAARIVSRRLDNELLI